MTERTGAVLRAAHAELLRHARRLLLRFPVARGCWTAEDLAQESVVRLLQRARDGHAYDNPVAAAKTTMRHLALDECVHAGREVELDPEHPAPRSDGSEDADPSARATEWWAAYRRGLRAALDDVKPPEKNAVNLAAVLLVELRAQTFRRLRGAFASEPGSTLAWHAEELVEWRPPEQKYNLKRDFRPVLRVHWADLRSTMAVDGQRLGVQTLCEALCRALDEPLVNEGLWNVWVLRAKEHARNTLPPATYQATIGVLLRDVAARGRRRGKEGAQPC